MTVKNKTVKTKVIKKSKKNNDSKKLQKQVDELSQILEKLNEELERILIDESLKESNGVKLEAAKLLGWGRNTLARKARQN